MGFFSFNTKVDIERYGVNGKKSDANNSRVNELLMGAEEFKPWADDEISVVGAYTKNALDQRYVGVISDFNVSVSKQLTGDAAFFKEIPGKDNERTLMCHIDIGYTNEAIKNVTKKELDLSSAVNNSLRHLILLHEATHCDQAAASTHARNPDVKMTKDTLPMAIASNYGGFLNSLNKNQIGFSESGVLSFSAMEKHSDMAAILKLSAQKLGSDIHASDFDQRMKDFETAVQSFQDLRKNNSRELSIHFDSTFDIYDTYSSNLLVVEMIKKAAKDQSTHAKFQKDNTTPEGANNLAALLTIGEMTKHHHTIMDRLVNAEYLGSQKRQDEIKQGTEFSQQLMSGLAQIPEDCDVPEVSQSKNELKAIESSLLAKAADGNEVFERIDVGTIRSVRDFTQPGQPLEEANFLFKKIDKIYEDLGELPKDYQQEQEFIASNIGKFNMNASVSDMATRIKSLTGIIQNTQDICKNKNDGRNAMRP